MYLYICSQSNFSRLYDPTMACLKDILLKNTENSTKLICAKCLECISRVAVAVGKEKFSSDSIQVSRIWLLHFSIHW